MHLLPLRERLRAALESKQRWSWAREEFDRLEGTRWTEEHGNDAFLRLKGARELDRRELALLRELVAWRDGVARSLDRSTFRVAGNEVLLALAHSTAGAPPDLEHTKGLSRSIVQRFGTGIREAIERGHEVPEADLPRFPRGARWSRDPDYEDRVARVKHVRDRVAADLELDPGVLCPRERLEAVARRNPATLDELAEIPELRRWQVEVLGERFVSALGGRTGSDSPYRD